MIKIVAAGAGAALLLGSVMLLPGMTPMVNAGTAMQQRVVVISNAKAKADRLDIRNYGPGCSERGWPYYEATCIRDAANALAKRIRVVKLDHLPTEISFATGH